MIKKGKKQGKSVHRYVTWVSHSVSLVAKLLGVHRNTVHKMLQDGKLKGTTAPDLIAYLKIELPRKE